MENKLLVITTYPPKGKNHGKGVIGIAPATKNTLRAMKEHFDTMKITVFAEKLPGEKDSYKENAMTVNRIWERNTWSAFPKMLKEIFSHHKDTDTILIEFGLAVYGDFLYLIPLPFFLLALRILGKKVYFVFHEVVTNTNEVHGHMNIEPHSFRSNMFNLLFRTFYTFTLRVVTRAIVFDTVLRDRLKIYGKGKKIITIPLGTEQFSKLPTKRDARKKLGISSDTFVLLSFGFLAWYKGTDWIVHAIEKLKEENKHKKSMKKRTKLQLIVAGGPNPNRVNKEYYQRYIQSIEKKCQENGIILTGFVEEKDIPLYFQASDLVIYPYRTLMGASAVLTLAYSFKKPFMLSEAMSRTLKADDITELLKKLRLNKEQISYHAYDDFAKKVKQFEKNNTLRKKVMQLSAFLARERSWENVGKRYYEELFTVKGA